MGFGAAPDDLELLCATANRALLEIFTVRTVTKTVRLYTNAFVPETHIKMLRIPEGKSITLELNGTSYSMRVVGTGYYQLLGASSSSDIRSFSSGVESTLIHGFIYPYNRIKISSTYSTLIYDFSIFKERLSTNLTEIPDGGPTVTIDVKKSFPDFMCFLSHPTTSDGRIIYQCSMREGKLTVPSDYEGEIVLTYRRLPAVAKSGSDAQLDIPREYEHLLAPLVASYMLIESNPESAEFYRERYESLLGEIRAYTYNAVESAYVNLNGWA